MEYRLPELFETLPEQEKEKPLKPLKPPIKRQEDELWYHSHLIDMPPLPDDKQKFIDLLAQRATNKISEEYISEDRFISKEFPTFLAQTLKEMGVINNSIKEKSQLSYFKKWNNENFSIIKDFVNIYKKSKDLKDKKLLISSIKEIIEDINNSKSDHMFHSNLLDPRSFISRLAEISIFLTSKEKVVFFKWDANALVELDKKIIDHILLRWGNYPGSAEEIDSASKIRDFILTTNRAIEANERDKTLHKKLIKNLIIKLRSCGVIDSDIEVCNKQYNKFMMWDPTNVIFLDDELNLIGNLLTKNQKDYIKSIITKYNDNIISKTTYPPFDGAKVKMASFKYSKQDDGLSMSTQPALKDEINDLLFEEYEDIKRVKELITEAKKEVKKIKERDFYSSLDKEFGDLDSKTKVETKTTNQAEPSPPIDQDVGKYKTVLELTNNGLSIVVNHNEDSQFAKEAKKAGIRVAATQINKITKNVLSAALPGDDEAKLKQFLSSDLGTSFVSMISGMVLTYGLKDNEKAQIMAKEFRVSGMATAGNFVIEEILTLITDVVSNSLSENTITISGDAGSDPEVDIFYEEIEEEQLLLEMKI